MLFDFQNEAGRLRQNSGKRGLPESGWPSVTPATPAHGVTPVSPGITPAPGGASVPVARRLTPAKSKKRSKTELREELRNARNDLGEWMANEREAKAALAPFNARFWAAHERCAEVVKRWGEPPYGDGPARDGFKAAYADRLTKGCDSYPYRQRLKLAQAVVKGMQAHIKELATEIGDE